MLFQVHSYEHREPIAPPVQAGVGTEAPRTQPTAADILRLNRIRNRPQERTAEKEVDEYLNDSEEGSGSSLSFWQVYHIVD